MKPNFFCFKELFNNLTIMDGYELNKSVILGPILIHK